MSIGMLTYRSFKSGKLIIFVSDQKLVSLFVWLEEMMNNNSQQWTVMHRGLLAVMMYLSVYASLVRKL